MVRRLISLMSVVLAVGMIGNVSAVELGDYYVIEDFESYNTDGEMKVKWDGTCNYGLIGYPPWPPPPWGLKCLCLEYWTNYPPYYCGVSRTHDETHPWNAQDPNWADWTFGGEAETLSLWFSGDPNLSANGIDQLYSRITDSSLRVALVHYTDNWPVSDFDNGGYQEWNIALHEFKDDNSSIDLTNVKTFEIGILDGLGNPPAQMGYGFIYFDDIRLYPRRCVLKYGQPVADINDDCVVDWNDLKIIADDWLEQYFVITPPDLSEDLIINFLDYQILANGWLEDYTFPSRP